VKNEIEKQSQQKRQVRLMFQDEGRFGRINSPRRCWAPKGIRPDVPAQFVREYTYAYAAVSPHDGVMDSLILPEVNAQAMSIFLAEVASRHPDEFILMVMDQAAWHRAADLVVPENIKLEWQPPYSPQCNPVENLWDEIREKWFPNLVFKSLDDVEDKLVEALLVLENDAERTQGIAGFDWLVSINMNAT
jgi:transposase